MDSGFIDLDILLTRIRQPQSKAYFLEAIRAYKAGALRAALSSAWVALVYDMIAKYRELDGLGDAAAAAFVHAWDTATVGSDVRKLLELESRIIDDATTNTQIISTIARTHLERLRQDRHLCAHPAFSTEAELFEPTPELVRLHLVNAIDLVLSQEPRQGKAIFEQFDSDVQSMGFPSAHAKILDYVEQRYLTRVRSQNVKNFGVVLSKSLLKGTPPRWEIHRNKIASSLVAIRERAPNSWGEVLGAIVRLLDGIETENRQRAIAFIAEFPDFWPLLQAPTRTALEETVANAGAAGAIDYRILSAVTLPQFRAPLLNLIANFGDGELRQAIATKPVAELWPRAIETYTQSGSWRGSEANFRDLIAPFAAHLSNAQHDELLTAIVENGQNWDAADTPALLLALLKNTAPANNPTFAARDRFYRHLLGFRRTEQYEDVLELLRADGWTPPLDEPEEDD